MYHANLDLKAGNVIKCELPRIQEGQSREIDLELSGYYLIKEVRHHIEVGEVTTSLKLIRDSYGFKSTNFYLRRNYDY